MISFDIVFQNIPNYAKEKNYLYILYVKSFYLESHFTVLSPKYMIGLRIKSK